MTTISPSANLPSLVDPVTVEVIRNALSSIARQMNNNLARSAYTPIIYEMKDCSVGVFDRHGRLLGQSPGLPMFLGNLEMGIKVTTEKLGGPEHYRPGDVFMVNDPYLVGSHTYDVTIFSPIFHGERLIGFGATKAHWLDIGAKEAGRPVDTTEIYQEGYRFGPTYVYRAGEPETQVLDYITRNSRLPRSVWGDLHAQISACRTGERRLVALYERFGGDVVEAAAEEIFAQCERLDLEAVSRIPDGVYRAEGAMDSGGPGQPPVPVKVAVTVSGDRMSIDLTGSSGPTAGSVNSPLPGTVAGARLAYKCLINPNVPVTDGTFRNLTIVAPPDTVFNVTEPHATIYYYPPLGLMIDLVIRALADVLPDDVVAGQPADPMNVTFVGTRADGSRYVTGEATAVGWGASSAADGANGMINYGAGDLKNYPVEVLETRYPIRVNRYGLREGSGGPGRFRGGLGIVREYETLAEETYLSLWLERSTLPGWGLHGGGDGARTHGEIESDGVTEEVLKVGARPLRKGARIRVMTGGGGGYGPPAERDPAKRDADHADGYVHDSYEMPDMWGILRFAAPDPYRS
ncbi:hydantoinase B/oxoprolinase family protein [Acrocarpospora macrocephala]|uniref:5-oxoprolinase n=1 Tax=Acrocarpospora macrocephala TaxID=150177 RepID=A0A5M3WZG5_9ACTN|nr:hydantoinase B/oxoprolinase family protein [Acrocarpospora macrocephala]GES11823.1 5-oxoprolinase [Acrocarpospora macrocephala]